MSQANPAATSAAQTQTVTEEAKPKSVLDAILDRTIEYEAFSSKERISLTPRMVIRFLCSPTKSGRKCDNDQALRFCMLCRARGLNPWEGDAFIVGYDTKDGPQFSLITAHQAFLKRAEAHPDFDGMQSGVIVEVDGEIVEHEGDFYSDKEILRGGWAKIFIKGRTHPVYKRLRLDTFNKGFGRWSVDPGGMIVKCGEADALRSAFPNTLGGMYLEDELSIDAGAPSQGVESNGGNGNGNSKPSMPRRKSEATKVEPQQSLPVETEQSESIGETAADVCEVCGVTDLDRPLTKTDDGIICSECAPQDDGEGKVIDGVRFPIDLTSGDKSKVLLSSMQTEAARAGITLYTFCTDNLGLAPKDLNEEAARCMVEVLRNRPDKKK